MSEQERTMSDDWLQLTEEDIERAQQLDRQRAAASQPLTITSDDIDPDPEAAPPARGPAGCAHCG